jgi:hypothetical protein
MNHKTFGISLSVVFLALSFLTGCGGSSSTKTPPNQVVAITATTGSGQTAAVGKAFASPLVATVTTNGTPSSGVTVTFAVPTSGATGTFAGGATTASTDSSGKATSPVFTAGTTAGSYKVTASAPGATAAASFSLTNTATPASKITATSGSGQATQTSTAFPNPLVATVVDSNSNPVSGVVVTFTAPASGASGTFAGGASTATTDSSGKATSAVFTANATAGAYAVTASAPGVATPASFSLTNSATPVPTITVVSGSGQSATVNTAFANPLMVKVTTNGTATAGVVVTFTPPASGASGTFAGGVNTATTDATGTATSALFTANATVGGPYTIVASATGANSANFSLTNLILVTNYTFYMSGQDVLAFGSSGYPNYLALAGVVSIDANGNVVGGEQDYNDAYGSVAGDTSNDPITGGSLLVNSTTGAGTLTLQTANTTIGVSGTETFAVQFVNANHGLIMQFDGTGTSSGSIDIQTLPSTLSGGYSFTMSGVDTGYYPTAFGGVFSISGTALTSGVFDVNDAGTVATNQSFTGIVSTADSFGRGTITNAFTYGSSPIVLAYYIVGPKVIRIIDVDTTDAAVGSAYSQGGTTFSNASLANSVLAISGTTFSSFGAVGQFTTNTTAATISGVGEDSELDNIVQSGLAAPIAGTYSIAGNGYGNLTISPALGDVSVLGIYTVDPTLNLNDPNNTTSGGGGALVLDLDAVTGFPLAGGTGVLIPQTDTATSSFAGNYVAGWQDFNYFTSCADCEFDMVGQGTMTTGVLSLTGSVSDPFFTLFSGTGLYPGSTFSSTPAPDGANPGRYSMLAANSNALGGAIGGVTGSFDVVMYQASGDQLYWLDYETAPFADVFIGPVEYQAPGGLAGLPLARKPVKTQPKQKH